LSNTITILSNVISIYRFVSLYSIRTQQICLFSSSTILHARRTSKDKIDINATEDYDNEEDNEEEDDSETDQVIFFFPIKLLSTHLVLNRLILL